MTTNDMDMLEILKGERACGKYDKLIAHWESIKTYENSHGRYHCAWCGERCLTYCSLCPDEPPIHIRHHN
eukprot:CAMPEP_0204822274 /NCGR_PEP_ID=MMETSP1346-20131115/458_1 /ASSEMBLY_ACC=CAM_ASM_000771 /TAXON_ID=215587 /ORGANISM="Aplanochytrium stocchinoi, Strain GSBS06" /LENGTH=69 /DNA_ID=CAMNT_0051948385 /DNA_START=62 /DNA_END=268 /DNA_ORIENTATION=+